MTVTVEIEAEVAEGVSSDVQRVVDENCRTLRFRSTGSKTREPLNGRTSSQTCGSPVVERGAGMPSIGQDDFARRFSVRGANLMWLLGAGASNAAGLPTANDLVVEFKRMLYVSQSGRPVRPGDLAQPAIRNRIEAHVGTLGLPESGDPEEYAAFFEAAFPHEADRAKFVDGQLGGAKPSYGHMALASLMAAGLCRLVWTTNSTRWSRMRARPSSGRRAL